MDVYWKHNFEHNSLFLLIKIIQRVLVKYFTYRDE